MQEHGGENRNKCGSKADVRRTGYYSGNLAGHDPELVHESRQRVRSFRSH